MIRPLFALALALGLHLEAPQDSFQQDYERAAEARDAEQLAALWRAEPGRALPTFDGDLEASLALWESDREKPDLAGIARLEQRALFAAQQASRALDRPLLEDYASAFVGWNEVQRLEFRAGQRAFGKSRELAKAGDQEGALSAALDCAARAESLGDWWGLAMGAGGAAGALMALERYDEALVQASRARLINQQLGLSRDELSAALLVAECCVRLQRFERGLSAAQSVDQRLEQGPAPLRRRALAARHACELGLGQKEAAAETQERLEALPR
jgi:tetratricopeptide (TPR) repeat protein